MPDSREETTTGRSPQRKGVKMMKPENGIHHYTDENGAPMDVDLSPGRLGDLIMTVRNAMADLDDLVAELTMHPGFEGLTGYYMESELPFDKIEATLFGLSSQFRPGTVTMGTTLRRREQVRRSTQYCPGTE